MQPAPPAADLTPSRTRGQRALYTVGVALLLLTVGDDLVGEDWTGPAAWPIEVVLVVGLPAVLWPARLRQGRRAATLRASVPALVSLSVTVAVILTGWRVLPGLAELAILLALLLAAVRSCSPGWAMTVGGLIVIAIALLPLRGHADLEPSLWWVFPVLLLIPAAGAAGLGGYLRTLDHNRRVAVTRTRQAERMAMAADLHDFVAHHVTGILVQAQVARMMAGTPSTEPGELDPVLGSIERAATQALASMRRTVGLLRDGAAAPGIGPTGDLSALADLVNGFGGPAGPVTDLRCAASLPGDLPPEVQSAAFRVVQESLTNVRRHAADATTVTVELARDGDMLRVAVCDDGRGGTRLPADARGGGFGLVGLTERVTALGGELRAGPRPGHGWAVTAQLPAPRP